MEVTPTPEWKLIFTVRPHKLYQEANWAQNLLVVEDALGGSSYVTVW